ncbi:hypothetical protein U1Q18_025133, partial [Sarracenia purpurea var. burkii]
FQRQTWVGFGNGGGASEITAARGIGLALVEAIEGIRGVSLKGVGKVTQPRRLNGGAVGSGAARVVERRLQRLVAGVAPRHAPRCFQHCTLHHHQTRQTRHHHCRRHRLQHRCHG